MKLIFYNEWHNGDIHYTRPFIRDIINKTSYNEYYYLHKNSFKLLKDIPNLIYGQLNEYCKESNIILKINNDELYVNVHLGCYDILFDDDVDSESHSILDTYYKLFSYIYEQLNLKIEKEDYYIPHIDYNSYDISNIDSFLNTNKYPKVLVCNGPVLANQFVDIDFHNMIDELSNEYPYILFILTHKLELNKENVFFTDNLINTLNGDLNEISYLSQFCEVIFGRPSGPYVFCHVDKNIKDRYKTFICPSNKLRWVTWGVKSSCKNVWITKTEYAKIYSIVSEELKKISSLTINDFDIRTDPNRIYIKSKVNITEEHDISINFYLYDVKKWEHKNYIADSDIEFWYEPFVGYCRDYHPIRIEFRTTRKLLFEITV